MTWHKIPAGEVAECDECQEQFGPGSKYLLEVSNVVAGFNRILCQGCLAYAYERHKEKSPSCKCIYCKGGA